MTSKVEKLEAEKARIAKELRRARREEKRRARQAVVNMHQDIGAALCAAVGAHDLGDLDRVRSVVESEQVTGAVCWVMGGHGQPAAEPGTPDPEPRSTDDPVGVTGDAWAG